MASKPTLGEIAQADHGIRMAKAYTSMLLENPDSVLQQRGRDMKLYDEILRDDQVKSCFQQRRLAVVTQSEWEVEPASERAEDKAAAEFIKEQLKQINFDNVSDKMLFGIFDIKGNNYRLVVKVRYRNGIVAVEWVLTLNTVKRAFNRRVSDVCDQSHKDRTRSC